MIEPMLVKKVDKIPEEDGYIYEQKFDGGRAIAVVNDGKVKLITRHGNNITNQFPEIVMELKKLNGNFIFDGEIVVFKNDRDDFTLYQKRAMLSNPFQIDLRAKMIPATFFIFDVLHVNGNDLRYNVLVERKKVLNNIGFDEVRIKHTIYNENPYFLLKIQHKIEGIVAKKKDSIYEEGKRSGAWIKYRFVKEAVIEAVEYEITPSGIVAIDEQGHRITINGKQAEAVMKTIDENGKARIEINYYEKSKNGMFRFPAFRRLIK